MTMPNDAARSGGGMTDAGEGDESRTGGARAQIREVKDQVVDQAKSSFRQARDSAADSLGRSREQAADRITGIANAFRSTSDHLRSESQRGVANLSDSLADQVDRLASYLRDRDLRGVRDDLESLARRQPAIVFGAALAVGMLGARFLKSSRRPDDDRDRIDRDWEPHYASGPHGLGSTTGYGDSSVGGGYGGA